MQRDWVIIGSPLDCSASDRGEQEGPRALRAAGIVQALGARDRGDVHGLITDGRRHANGVLAFEQIVAACTAVRGAVDEALADGATPLVIGGDCSFVIGALAGARPHAARVGTCFLDGHIDSYDGVTSPTGEVADMDIAIVCGVGNATLAGLAGTAPIVRPGDTVVIGHRPIDPDGFDEGALAHPLIQQIPAAMVERGDAAAIGAGVAERLALQAGAIWLHLDLDVFDVAAMPAVTYRQAQGLDFAAVQALVAAFAARDELIGVSIADLVPPRDPDGRHARAVVGLVADGLGAPR